MLYCQQWGSLVMSITPSLFYWRLGVLCPLPLSFSPPFMSSTFPTKLQCKPEVGRVPFTALRLTNDTRSCCEFWFCFTLFPLILTYFDIFNNTKSFCFLRKLNVVRVTFSFARTESVCKTPQLRWPCYSSFPVEDPKWQCLLPSTVTI